MSWKTIVVIPDTHVPDHHVRALEGITEFIAGFQPDEVLHLGDFLDCKGPARWSKGLAGEFADTLQDELDLGHKLLGNIREFHDGPFSYLEGNHEARIRNYLTQYAPAVSGLRGFRLAQLLGLDELEIDLRDQPYQFAPGWVAIHGLKLGAYAGASAMKMVKVLGKNVVQGHSHRSGIISETTDKTRTGVEFGHISDIRKASYLPLGAANWQMSFGVLNVKGSHVHPELIPIRANGAFHYAGEDYGPGAAA